MSENKTSANSERYVALVLRVGAYGSFVLLLVAIAFSLAGIPDAALIFAKVGVIFLMATPTVRIIAALAMYISERDKTMILVSLGVLTIVIVSSLLGLKLH
ncbi:MAG: hypothetical protein JWO13_1913 [Acidobacteriales bacterium]|nr:hypothetical protein [Terriglobales bacterium]